MADSKKRKLEESYLSLEEMNKSKELLLEKSKAEQKIITQALKDVGDLESILRSEMDKTPPMWTDAEFDKLGIRAALEAVKSHSSLFDKEILAKVERVMPTLVTYSNRLPKVMQVNKIKKEAEEKRSSSASANVPARSNSSSKVPKDVYDKIERLEERVADLEEQLSGYKESLRKLEKLVKKS